MVFLSLLALDFASHWLQMYRYSLLQHKLFIQLLRIIVLGLPGISYLIHSTFLSGKASHKDVNDSTSWLFRLYYGNRMFMGYCCVSCEVIGSLLSELINFFYAFLLVDIVNTEFSQMTTGSLYNPPSHSKEPNRKLDERELLFYSLRLSSL